MANRDMDSPDVCVIVVNYNARDHLNRCISALRLQTYENYEVIIVDNASQDDSLSKLGNLPSNYKIIKNDENLGFAAANNIAVRNTESTWIATLNPDAIPDPDWLQKLVSASVSHPSYISFASVLISDKDPSRLDGAGDVYHLSGLVWRGGHGRSIDELPSSGEVFSACSAAALYRKDIFEEVGGFDEHFFCYIEDVDLGFRMRLRGGKCLLVSDSFVRHVGSAITGRHSSFTAYHSTRNIIWTFSKNVPGPLLIFLIPIHVLALGALVIFASKNKVGLSALRGLFDGFKGIAYFWSIRRSIQSQRTVPWWCFLKIINFKPFSPIFREFDVSTKIGNV